MTTFAIVVISLLIMGLLALAVSYPAMGHAHLSNMLDNLAKKHLAARRETRHYIAAALPDRETRHVVTFMKDPGTGRLNVLLDGKDLLDASGNPVAPRVESIWQEHEIDIKDLRSKDEDDPELHLLFAPVLRDMIFSARAERD